MWRGPDRLRRSYLQCFERIVLEISSHTDMTISKRSFDITFSYHQITSVMFSFSFSLSSVYLFSLLKMSQAFHCSNAHTPPSTCPHWTTARLSCHQSRCLPSCLMMSSFSHLTDLSSHFSHLCQSWCKKKYTYTEGISKVKFYINALPDYKMKVIAWCIMGGDDK